MKNDHLPLTEQYAKAAACWVDAEAAASLLEDTKSSVLASMMGNLGDIAINRAEQQVKASVEWRDHVHNIVEARREANHAKVQLEYIKMCFQQYMSQEANNRTEARL